MQRTVDVTFVILVFTLVVRMKSGGIPYQA